MENKELSKNKYGIEYTKVGDFYLPNIQILHYQKQEEQVI